MKIKDFLKGLLAGAAVGTAAGVMLAPKSGKETREDVKKFLLNARKEVERKFKEAKNMTQKEYEKIVDSVVKEGSKTVKIAKRDLGALKKNLIKEYKDIKKKIK